MGSRIGTAAGPTVAAAAAGNNNGPPPPAGGGYSIDDDADSGIGKLRYNKREQELPEALQGEP